MHSTRDSSVYAWGLSEGDQELSNEIAPPLEDVWVVGGLAIGWPAPNKNGLATDTLVAIDVKTSNRRWEMPTKQRPIVWADETFIMLQEELLDRETGGTLLRGYSTLVRTASPDLLLACDPALRASAVNPKTGFVYWKQGQCTAVAAPWNGKRGAHLAGDELSLFEISTGAELWKVKLAGVANEPDIARLPLPPQVFMDEERIYVVTSSGTTAHALTDGAVLWRSELFGLGTQGSGALAVALKETVEVLDAATGKPRFRAALPIEDADRFSTNGKMSKALVQAKIAGGRLIVRTHRKVAAFDLTSGEIVWSHGVRG